MFRLLKLIVRLLQQGNRQAVVRILSWADTTNRNLALHDQRIAELERWRRVQECADVRRRMREADEN